MRLNCKMGNINYKFRDDYFTKLDDDSYELDALLYPKIHKLDSDQIKKEQQLSVNMLLLKDNPSNKKNLEREYCKNYPRIFEVTKNES